MKNFLKYLLSIPQRIGIYFAKRRALREYRRELEHKRAMQRLTKSLEMIAAVAQMTELVAKSAQAFIEERNRKFPPGGIAMPGNNKGPDVDDREWFVNGERVISGTPTDNELVDFKKRWQAQQPNFTPKEMESYNKYLSDDRDFSKNPLCYGREVYQSEIGAWIFCDTGELLTKMDVGQILFPTLPDDEA